MEFKDQAERITYYEGLLNEAVETIAFMGASLDAFKELQPKIKELDEYYGSESWKQDLADDDAGLLPEDLNRGVLSEDGIWNVLTENKDIIDELKELF